MGMIAKSAKKISEQNKGFKPLVLSEGNVLAMFNRCLATNNTQEYIKSILETKEHGYSQDSPGILFDRQKILENLLNIKYMYGQLLTSHKKSNSISASPTHKSNVMTNYAGEIWTTDKSTIMRLFHLGVASGTIHPFSSRSGGSSFKSFIPPTLSPEDPNFPAWWTQHKSEWEAPVKSGRKPIVTSVLIDKMNKDFDSLSDNEINQLIEGYKELSDTDRENFDIKFYSKLLNK